MNETTAALEFDVVRRCSVRPARISSLKPMLRRGSAEKDDLGRLVEAIASSQDRAAFATLFEIMGPRVKTFLIKGGATSDVAEEIVQETMLTVWRKASYFDASRARAATWIFTIARNRRIDWQRRQARTGEASLDPVDEADPLPSPEDAVLSASRDERVRKALAGLSPEQETIVRLSFFSEKPHSEIARELDLPLGTVKSRVRLALAHLRRLLDEAS